MSSVDLEQALLRQTQMSGALGPISGPSVPSPMEGMIEQTGGVPQVVRETQIQLGYDKLRQDYGPAVEKATKQTVIELKQIDPNFSEGSLVGHALREMRQAEGAKAPTGPTAKVPESEIDLMNPRGPL
jgi:hypothetical protein